MALSTDGEWGAVFDTEIMGIHQVLLGDGRVLYWGDDGLGNAFSNTQSYAVYDPITGEFEVLSESYVIRMFCGAGVIIPGTDQVLIAGGNGIGADDGKIFDTSDESLINSTDNLMATDRFYPTMVSLSTGQLVILGGNGPGCGTPEIFTVDEGWRTLDGAFDADVEANWWYPKTWVNNKGEVLYIALSAGNQNSGTGAAGSFELMAMDVSGEGSIRQVAEVPFQMDVRSTAVMYDVGKIVVMDHVGDLWTMDINGDTPVFEFVADLPTERENGDMTVLADGRILLNGGSELGNSQDAANAVFESIIFDPFTGEFKVVDSEDVLRLYHSSSLLLPDGTVISSGGGGLGGTLDFQDAQIYRPDYLFNDDGTLADRPVISIAPDTVVPSETFVITVDDASTIARLSFVKTGAVTHSTNMESGRMDLNFTVLSPTQIEVTLPENPHVLGAGNWMLFAIDTDGVPSVAPIISVLPTLTAHTSPSGTLTAEYFVLNTTTTTALDQIDFTQPADAVEEGLNQINFNAGTGSFYAGGPVDDFAARITGEFDVSTAGNHTFYLNSDDGSRLLIDGQVVINNDGIHAPVDLSATVNLSAGSHTIEVIYFERGGGAVLDLEWAGPGFSRQQMLFDDTQGENLPDTIVNGDFEDISAGTGAGSTPEGWVTTGDESGVFAATEARGDGFAYALGGWSSVGGQTLEQKVGLTDGQLYRLSFDAGDAIGGVSGRLLVVAGNDTGTQILASLTAEELGNSSQYTADFVAYGGATSIKFIFDGDGAGDIDIDNVSLIEVTGEPEATDDLQDVILVSETAGAARIDGTNVLANDSDPNGDPISIVAVNGVPVASAGWQGWRDASNGGQIVVNTDGRVQFRDINGDFTSLPLGEQVETSITYTIADGNGGTDTATITFVIEGTALVGENIPPDAVDDVTGPILASALTDGGNVVKISGDARILLNDSDLNGDALSIVAIDGTPISGPGWQGWRDASNGGQIVINTDGRVQFRDPEGDFAFLPVGQQVETSVSYTISDGNEGTDTALVTFVIEGTFEPGEDVAPDAVDDPNGPILAADLQLDGVVQKIDGQNILSNDSDSNGDPFEIVDVNGQAVTTEGWQGWFDASNGGQIALNTDGRIQFRDIDFDFANLAPGEVVETSIDYTIADTGGLTDTATITFSVTQDDILPLDTDAVEIIG